MASTTSTKILEVSHVSPSSISLASLGTELTLPFSFSDIFNLKYPPVQCINFYKLARSTPAFFHSVILPKLKHSLSLTLSHFLPVAGHIIWPPDSSKPIIIYNTPYDGVTLTVAESNADLDHLYSDVRDAVESRPYVAPLSISDNIASIYAAKITLFPNQGFAIGHTINHAVLDGRSQAIILNAWAYICKQLLRDENFASEEISFLPEEVAPAFDRSAIRDPEGLDMVYLNAWSKIKLFPDSDDNPRSLKTIPIPEAPALDTVRKTFEISRQDLRKLQAMVFSHWDNVVSEEKPVHLSAFVLTFAYTIVCLVKTRGFEGNDEVRFGFTVDCRGRLDPPISKNYVGNCVTTFDVLIQVAEVKQENGIAYAAKRIKEVIKEMDNGVLKGAKEKIRYLLPLDVAIIFVSGSSRFGMYGADFGWGRPKNAEITNIDLIEEIDAFSMMESKDDNGGTEVGIALKKHEMKMFNYLFVNGLTLLKCKL